VLLLSIVFATAVHVPAGCKARIRVFGGGVFVSVKAVFCDRKFRMIKYAYLLLMDKHIHFSVVSRIVQRD
jgi:hypothetical protein